MTPPPSLSELIQSVLQDSPTETSIDLLVTASRTVSQIEELNDALMEHFIDRCRREGKSWSEISAALGVSKQAVHKRFSVPLADRIVRGQDAPRFERFTDRARTVIRMAALGARQRGHDEVSGTDMLLALFAEPQGLAARALDAMGVTAAAVAAAAWPDGRPAQAAAAGAGDAGAHGAGAGHGPGDHGAGDHGPGDHGPGDHGAGDHGAGDHGAGDHGAGDHGAGDHGAADMRVPFGAEAKTALRDTLAEAIEMGHNYIGTEHILLGLMRDPDAPTASLLRSVGATPTETRVRVTEMLRGYAARQAQAAQSAQQAQEAQQAQAEPDTEA